MTLYGKWHYTNNRFDSLSIFVFHCTGNVMCLKHKPLTDRSIFVNASTQRWRVEENKNQNQHPILFKFYWFAQRIKKCSLIMQNHVFSKINEKLVLCTQSNAVDSIKQKKKTWERFARSIMNRFFICVFCSLYAWIQIAKNNEKYVHYKRYGEMWFHSYRGRLMVKSPEDFFFSSSISKRCSVLFIAECISIQMFIRKIFNLNTWTYISSFNETKSHRTVCIWMPKIAIFNVWHWSSSLNFVYIKLRLLTFYCSHWLHIHSV